MQQKLNRGKRTLSEAKATSSAYRYSPLAELVSGYAAIYGVVVNLTLPKKTSGRDMVVSTCCRIRKTDVLSYWLLWSITADLDVLLR